MLDSDAAAQMNTKTDDFVDVLCESAIEQQNRLSAERNAQRRELISRDRRTSSRALLRKVGKRQ